MKTNRFIIGITGGIATGKTTVLKELKRHGAAVISADDLAHEAILKGRPVYAHILKRFGRGILGTGGQIDRRRLGAIVFARPRERRWLERQIHPWVRRRLIGFIRKNKGFTALDIPLLFEAGYEKDVDATVVVWSPRSVQLDRLKKRNGLNRRAALQRIYAQMPLTVKRKRADFVINNEGRPAALRHQIIRMLLQIKTHMLRT